MGGGGWELRSPDVAWGAVWTLGAPQWLPVACVVNAGLKEPPGPAVLSGAQGPMAVIFKFGDFTYTSGLL